MDGMHDYKNVPTLRRPWEVDEDRATANMRETKTNSVRRFICCFLDKCKMYGPVAQWIRHLTTNQGIPGLSPGGVDCFSLTEVRELKCTQNIHS